MEPCTSQPKKPPKNHLQKYSLYFWKWNFPALTLKKFLYFLKRKLFLYFLKRKLFLYFQKWTPRLFIPSSKNERNLARENFLCFSKRKP